MTHGEIDYFSRILTRKSPLSGRHFVCFPEFVNPTSLAPEFVNLFQSELRELGLRKRFHQLISLVTLDFLCFVLGIIIVEEVTGHRLTDLGLIITATHLHLDGVRCVGLKILLELLFC